MARQPQEAALFDQEIAVLASAFALRKPDAFERAGRLLTVIDTDLAFVQRVANARMRTVGRIAAEAEARVAFLSERRGRLVELVDRHKNMNLLRAVDEGATPEAANKPARVDPVQMLFEKELLTIEQVRDAREIVRTFEGVCRRLFARTMRWSAGHDRSRPIVAADGPDDAQLHGKVYLPWAAAIDVMQAGTFALLVAILIDGRSVYDVAREQHVSWETTVRRLGGALDLYRVMRERLPPPEKGQGGSA